MPEHPRLYLRLLGWREFDQYNGQSAYVRKLTAGPGNLTLNGHIPYETEPQPTTWTDPTTGNVHTLNTTAEIQQALETLTNQPDLHTYTLTTYWDAGPDNQHYLIPRHRLPAMKATNRLRDWD